MPILYGVIIVATIYRLVSLEEFILWKGDCINSIYNSIQNEGLFIPENIHKNYKDNIPKGLSFFYKLEQIFTGSLYQPNSYCIISLTIPDEILKKYAVVGHYFGYISNGMKTAYEYLLPKEILEEYINSFRIICDSDRVRIDNNVIGYNLFSFSLYFNVSIRKDEKIYGNIKSRN